MKYCSTFSPSRKFALIGVSMMEPSGFAISPRIPASCLIWACEPRAPESAIMKIELNDAIFSFSPRILVPSSTERFFIIAFPTSSAAPCQISTTLLYFSPLVTRPFWNWLWISSISFSAFAMMVFFSSGMSMSSTHTDEPESAAKWKPVYMIWSAKMTVSFTPRVL